MAENPSRLASISSPAAWRQIVDSAAETAIICLDTDGLVRMWSAGATRILGWTEPEMLGQPLDRIFTEEDRERHRVDTEMMDARTKGRGGGEEGWRVCKDGHAIWAVGEMSAIRDAEGRHIGFVKILRDRTAQRESEEAVLEERRTLEILNRAGAALARETDLQRVVQVVTDAGVELTGAQFGAFFYNVVDDAGDRYTLYTLSGASRDDFAGFPMPRNTAVFAPTFNGESIVRSDDITKDPRYGRNAPRKGMPEGHLPVRSYLAVPVVSRTDEVLGGLFFGHAKAGVFTERSERGLVGLAAEAAVAIDNARLAHQGQRELAERRRVEAELRELNATLEAKVEQRTQELHRHAEAVRQLQKMEAVGQLTGGVAHDFNNLLQVIVGNLEIIRRSAGADNARILRAVELALDGARAGAAMTQRLLAFARRQPLDPKPIDVNVLVNGMSELMHRALGETIEIEVVLGAGLWRIEADANELERAILNLAVNARDAMPEGGKLTVETANCHIDEAYASLNPEASPGQYVAISVTDTGTGMDADTMRQAFEPFFTTKPVGRGTGLGLSQVYGFVKQSGGHVKLYSEPGVGTMVRMYLPRLQGAAAQASPSSAPAAAQGGRQEVVLVVEDDDKVRSLSVEMLRELGYQVLEAADGPRALQILEVRDDVALLFTDVVLPGGMTGAQVAARAKASHPALQVLFTTGYARNAIVHHGRLDPGVQLLTKPFTFADLAAKVRAILDRR
jgi:PAS domain S-box-containing protein